MLRTYKAKVEQGGVIRLTEPASLPESAEVFVSIIEDEETIGGIPVTMLLSEKALAEYWDTPEEDEAWKDFQNQAK
jgi:hypothetical protein